MYYRSLRYRFTILFLLLVALWSHPAASQASSPTSAAAIDTYLQKYNSPMAGSGTAYMRWGTYFNVDPRFIVAISAAESSLGKNTANTYNAWGWFLNGSFWTGFAAGIDTDTVSYTTAPGYVAGKGISMATGWEDGIFWDSKTIGKSDLGIGLSNVDAIAPVYCTDGTAQWITNVKSALKELGGDPNQLAFPGTANAAQAVLVPGGQWMNGQGVDAYDNGGDPNNDFGANTIDGVYIGEKWQCVELPQRLYYVRGWRKSIFPVAAAYQIYDKAGDMGMEAHANGSGYVPVPGDMVVLSGGSFGHVAVVDTVDNNNVNVVEQNWPGSGDRHSFARSGNNGSVLAGRGGYTVRGIVHSPNNHNTNGGGNPPPVVTTVVSESDTATTEGQPGFFRHGTPRYWNDATDSGDGGHMLWTYTGGANLDNIGDWRPNLPDTRNYEVFVYIPRLHATTHQAHYEIYGADGTTNKVVDQYAYSDVWVSLGTYKFNAGTSGWLRLVDGYNEPYDGKTKVGFDTAKWEARDAPDTTPPTVTITSGHANGGVYAGPQRVTWRIDDKGGSGIERWGQAWDSDPGANPYTADSGYLDLPLGTHTLNVHVRDKAGNEQNWTFGPFTLVIDVGRGSGGNVDQRYIDCYNRVGPAILGSVTQDGGNYVHAATGTFGNGGAQDLAGGSGGHNIIMARDSAALAYSVRGNIWNLYSGMGFGSSPLGFPTSDEQDADPSPQGTVGRVNHFEDGVITSAAPGTYEVHGNTFHKYANLAGSGGVLGFPASENVAIPATDSRRAGTVVCFEGGMIDDSSLGTFELHGSLYAKDYGTLRLVTGVGNFTGHLTGDMQNAAGSPFGTTGQVCHFEHGDLYATTVYKVRFVSGDILKKYLAAGASGGRYGFPTSDVYTGSGGPKQDFEGGTLSAGADSSVSSVSHVLWNNQDGRASIWNYDGGAGSFTQNSYGPFSGWAAAALADGPDAKTRVLWNNASGAASMWSLDNAAGSYAHFEFGPFSGWTAKSLCVSAGNTTHLLWTNANGAASVWNYDAGSGGYTHREYGPFAGWTAKAVADGPDAVTRLLWTSANGQMSLWGLDNVTGAYTHADFGPYAGWTAGMLSVGKDGTTHIAWTNSDGRASVWNYSLGSAGFAQLTYGAFAGWAAQSLADSADGTACVLWDNTNGSASLWGLNIGTGAYTYHEFGPYAGWTAIAVSAGP